MQKKKPQKNRQFKANFSNIDVEDYNNTSQEESGENENDLQISPAIPKHTRKHLNKDKLPSKKSPESKPTKMPHSTSKGIRLRGVYVPLIPSKHRKSYVLKYRKPIMAELKRKMKIGTIDFKYHYTLGNEVLLDFERYTNKFAIKTVKSAGQRTGDVRSIWMACDPDMSIHPNVFADNEVIESRFYLAQRNLLKENKDKEPYE